MVSSVTFALVKNDAYIGMFTDQYHTDGKLDLDEIKAKLKSGIPHKPDDYLDIHILGIYPVYPPINQTTP